MSEKIRLKCGWFMQLLVAFLDLCPEEDDLREKNKVFIEAADLLLQRLHQLSQDLSDDEREQIAFDLQTFSRFIQFSGREIEFRLSDTAKLIAGNRPWSEHSGDR